MSDRCAECGFEYRLDEYRDAGPAILEEADQLAAVLCDVVDDPARRRIPDTWSPLEYCCHLRDMLLVQRERVILARWRDTPSLAPMARDLRADFDGYAEQDPMDVARQLVDAARLFANVLARLQGQDWNRRLVYNFPHPTERTLAWVALHTLHEVRHHRLDVGRQLT